MLGGLSGAKAIVMFFLIFMSLIYSLVFFAAVMDSFGPSGDFGEWQHVACTYDGLVVKLYVDGSLVATSNKQIGDISYPPEDYDAKQKEVEAILGWLYQRQNQGKNEGQERGP